MFKTHTYKKSEADFSSLLNYGLMADNGVISCKDGQFLAGWRFSGQDISSSDADERNYITDQINAALCELGTGWQINCATNRAEAASYLDTSKAKFAHPAFEFIDNERADFFINENPTFETQYFLFASWMPSNVLATSVQNLIFDSNESKTSNKREKDLATFLAAIGNLERRLNEHLNLHRLVDEVDQYGEIKSALLSALHLFICGRDNPIYLPMVPTSLDLFLGEHDLHGGITPKLDHEHLAVLTIAAYPSASYPNCLDFLDKLPCSYQLCTRFIALGAPEASAQLETERKKWKQKEVSLKDHLLKNPNPRVNEDAVAMGLQYEHALNLVQSGLLLYGHYTATVVVRDADLELLANKVEYIKGALEQRGFSTKKETVNAVEAFIGGFPSDAIHNIRRPLISTENLAHLLPTSSLWIGNPYNDCPYYQQGSSALMRCKTDGNSPFYLNLHNGDLGHTLVFGPTRAGKSTLLATLVAQGSRYENAQHFVFDKGYSSYAIANCGGHHYDICVSPDVAFAPLAQAQNDLNWAVDFVVFLLKLQEHQVSAHDRIEVTERLADLVQAGADITLTALSAVLNPTMSAALYFYCEGSASELLNNPEDHFNQGGLHVFEIGELMDQGEAVLLPTLHYLFRRIERSLDGRPTFLWIDEAWVALKHPEFASRIREWLKTFAKLNCCVVLFTQSLSDASSSGLLDVLVESCPTKIFLPNPDAQTDVIKPIYKEFGLNNREIQIIATAERKRHYFIKTPAGNRLFELGLGPLTLEFVGRGSKEDLATINRLVNAHGTNWWLEYLIERSVASKDDVQNYVRSNI